MKTALLTGGSGGIGSATMKILETRGWYIIAPTRAELDFDNDAFIVPDRVAEIYFDAMIFCHGEWYSNSYHLPKDWEYQFRMRVVNPMRIIQVELGFNRTKSVIMVSSTRGLIGGVNTAPYAAACAAQIALMQGYAREYSGVRFNCVCPGLTNTRMGERVRATGGCKPGAVAQPPEFVANVIVDICEDGVTNGKVIKIVNSIATHMQWSEVKEAL